MLIELEKHDLSPIFAILPEIFSSDDIWSSKVGVPGGVSNTASASIVWDDEWVAADIYLSRLIITRVLQSGLCMIARKDLIVLRKVSCILKTENIVRIQIFSQILRPCKNEKSERKQKIYLHISILKSTFS